MITLAHISDIHLAPLPPVRPTELIGKRITGFLNWKFKRQKLLEGDGLTRLVRHLREQVHALLRRATACFRRDRAAPDQSSGRTIVDEHQDGTFAHAHLARHG